MSTCTGHKSITAQENTNNNETEKELRKSVSKVSESKRSIIVEQAIGDLTHTSSAKRFLQEQDEMDANSIIASNKSKSKIVVQKEKDGKGALVSLGENHPFELLGLNVALVIVNLILVIICMYGLPGLPNLDFEGIPTFDFERMDTGVTLESISKCMVASIAVPAIFLVTAWFLYRIPSTIKDANKEDKCSKKSCNKENMNDLAKFICCNPKLVFWTGYALAFLNAMQLILCYCGLGLPEILMSSGVSFSLPDMSLPNISFGLPELSFDTSFATWNNRGSFNPCEYQMSCTAIISMLYMIPPFLLRCPLSPMYLKNGTERDATKTRSIDDTVSGEKDSELKVKNKQDMKSFTDVINENAENLFWLGYGLSFVNVLLVIFCFCGVPNICNIWPFALVCSLGACMINCATRDEES
jgi:hypothetical protein